MKLGISRRASAATDGGRPGDVEPEVEQAPSWDEPDEDFDQNGYEALLQESRETFEFNPDQPRDYHGRWTGDGGEGGGPQQTSQPAPAASPGEQFAALKGQWATLDQQLLPYAGHPDNPAAKAIIDQQIKTVNEMHALNIDQGNAEGIGKPGGPRDVVVVGAGPAGEQAAIYGGAEGLDTLMVDQSQQAGGQIGLTSRTENVLGFPAGETGAQLAQDGLTQAQRLGAETKLGVGVTGMSYDPQTGLKTLTMSDGSTVDARSVVIAGGVQFNTMDFPGADSKGVIYGNSAAIKENGGPAVFVGGGNSAGQAAVDVANNGQQVTMLVRGDEGSLGKSMSSYLTDQLENNPNVTVRYNSEIASAAKADDGSLQSVTLKDGTEIPANNVGVFIGSSPQTDWAGVARDDHGYIETGKAGRGSLETSIPGVYAAGDVRSDSMHRVIGAAGEGGNALADAWQYVNKTFGQGPSQGPTPQKPWGYFDAAKHLLDERKAIASQVAAAKTTKMLPGDDFLAEVKKLDAIQPFTGFDPEAPAVPPPHRSSFAVRYGFVRR